MLALLLCVAFVFTYEVDEVENKQVVTLIEEHQIVTENNEISLGHGTEMETVMLEIIEYDEEKEITVLPDIVDVDVRIYNDKAEGFNYEDGCAYLNDIYAILKEKAPEGMHKSAAMAMSYTEGGAGKKGLYRSTNNCFGIRATPSWGGYVYARSTGKVYRDYETAKKYGASDFFRAYESMEDSVEDYINLMQSDSYAGALKTKTPKAYLQYVLGRGYGDSSLLNMWLGVIEHYDLAKYDTK